jgi:hypothetical protein
MVMRSVAILLIAWVVLSIDWSSIDDTPLWRAVAKIECYWHHGEAVWRDLAIGER